MKGENSKFSSRDKRKRWLTDIRQWVVRALWDKYRSEVRKIKAIKDTVDVFHYDELQGAAYCLLNTMVYAL